jgi:hypothetical protein
MEAEVPEGTAITVAAIPRLVGVDAADSGLAGDLLAGGGSIAECGIGRVVAALDRIAPVLGTVDAVVAYFIGGAVSAALRRVTAVHGAVDAVVTGRIGGGV